MNLSKIYFNCLADSYVHDSLSKKVYPLNGWGGMMAPLMISDDYLGALRVNMYVSTRVWTNLNNNSVTRHLLNCLRTAPIEELTYDK